MAGEKTTIVPFGADSAPDSTGTPSRLAVDTHDSDTASQPCGDEHAAWVESDTDLAAEASSPRSFWLAPVVAGLALAGWTALVIAAYLPAISTHFDVLLFSRILAQWSMPAGFIVLVLLLVLRSSTREAHRFGEAAAVLSSEADRLETRMATINRELSLAREFLTSQSRDLETLGRLASERITGNATKLEGLIRENGNRVETIGTVSARALDNMEKLRDQLPVIASSAKDVTNNIAHVGIVANGQLDDMIKGFNRLNEFGVVSERQVESLRQTTQETLGNFERRLEQLRELAHVRFATLSHEADQLRGTFDQHERDALSTMRQRIAALDGEIGEARAQLDMQEAESLTSLRARLTALRDESEVVSRAFRESEQRALHTLRSTLAGVEEEQQRRSVELEQHQQAALAALLVRLNEAGDEVARLDAALASDMRTHEQALERRRKAALETQATDAEQLDAILARIDDAVAQRHEKQAQRLDALARQSDELTALLSANEGRFAAIVDNAEAAQVRLEKALADLAEHLDTARADLGGTSEQMTMLGEGAERLLELVRSSARVVHDNLPEALNVNEDRLIRLDHGVSGLLDLLRHAADNGAKLNGGLDKSQQELRTLNTALLNAQEAIASRSAAHAGLLETIAASLADIEQSSERTSEKAQSTLREAVTALSDASRAAVSALDDDARMHVQGLAQRLASESEDAIDKAMRAKVAEISGRLEQAVAHATGMTREAATQLQEQIASVDSLVESLEARVETARSRAEEQVDNDFARRAAIITESLNSNAIDIAGALSIDVTDTAWAAYLRGDRGIFTRRAVSLLDAGEVKAVQQTYERDDTFRDHVNRYIHDFESILRQILSTRDGKALGVTLLSSDMGKLYVALAQGIERLRG